MRLRRLRAAVFGPHRDLDLDLDADIVLIFGRNESGKSCFREAVETILYGFEPSKRDAHPLYLWNEGSGDLHVEADLVLDDGSALSVERVLQADGKSRTAKAGEAFEGPRKGNAPLPQVAGLPQKLYETVYSLEVAQLAALEGVVQKHVDDLLLPVAKSLRLHPISKIRRNLAEEHQRLWRGDNRGKPRARELMHDLSEARARAQTAARDERELRDALAEKADLEAKLAADREEKADLERVARNAPYLRDLFELFQRERELGKPVDLCDLDGRPLVDPASLEESIAQLDRELGIPRARLEREAVALEDHHRSVLDASADVRFAVTAFPEHLADVARRDQTAESERSLKREAQRAIAGVLTRSPGSDDLESFAALPVARLRSAQASWARAWEEHAKAPASAAARPPAWALALAAVGVLVASFGAFRAVEPWAVLLGVLLTAGAAVASFAARASAGRERREPPARPAEVAEILAGVPVSDALLASPAEMLRFIEIADQARNALDQAARASEESSRLQAKIAERERSWISLCSRLGLGESADPGLLVRRLEQAIEAAEAARVESERDAGERRESRIEIEAREPALQQLRAHLEAVERALRRNEPGAPSLEEAYARVCLRSKGQEFVRERRAELARDPRWSAFCDDPRVTGERAPEAADWLPSATRARDDRLAALNEAIEAASERLGELRTRLRRDEGSHSARALDDVCAIEDALAQVRRERDRLALLDSILGRAEQLFREEHQPDVLRRASAYLARVTGGRYHRLYYLEGEDGGLQVACADRSEPVPVAPPISRGTLDQIFLCLRLGLLEHLDEDRETLPLILDDALLRMDDERRSEVYALLADIAPGRQVFLLTCHAAIAGEAAEALEAARIDLSLS